MGLMLGMMVHRRLRQEDYRRFKNSLSCIVSSRLVWSVE